MSEIDGERAARWALFRLQSALPLAAPLREGVCAIGFGSAPVSIDEAAQWLAGTQKPFVAYSVLDGDLMTIELRMAKKWRDQFAGWSSWPTWIADSYRSRGGERFRERLMLCAGRGEGVFLTIGELEAWERLYPHLGGTGWSEYGPEEWTFETTIPAALLAEARERDVAVVRVYNERSTERDDHIWAERYDAASPSLPMCEQCGERVSRFGLHWFESERPTRNFCQRCIDTALGVQGFNEARDMERLMITLAEAERTMGREDLIETAEEQAMWFASKYRPPFVRDFIGRHRAPP